VTVYVGTCGFSYRDWVGPFYPKGTKPAHMLTYYAGRFGAVEIDSTYYATPAPSVFASMERRTPAEFRFCVKAPGSLTHLPLDADLSLEEARAFARAVEALRSGGKLGAILAQFPHSLRPTPRAWDRLRRLRELWSPMPLVAEFRHRDWQTDATLRLLREWEIGLCNVDEPRLGSLMRPAAEVTARIGYVRFHGRNAARWWRHDQPAERYDYLYSESELAEWVERLAALNEQTDETYVFFNNHRFGQATLNAEQFMRMLAPSV
jgi:uncharacterized protein YecE (DUF72 family)